MESRPLTSSEVHAQIRREATRVFAKFSYETVVCNDTQYDIESMEHEFNRLITLAGGTPDINVFYTIIRSCCKKPSRSWKADDDLHFEYEEDDYG